MKKTSPKKRTQTAKPNSQATSEKFLLKRILVPIDFSEHSKNALTYAASFAKTFDAELLLVYVVEPTVYPADFGFGQVVPPAIEKEVRERGSKGLDQLVKQQIAVGVKARAIIRTGKPFLEIIDTAREQEIDLIIIATHGHTGVEHILFGSTAEKVVRKAPCPVLVVCSPERQFFGRG